jgi:subtilisin family serine protease
MCRLSRPAIILLFGIAGLSVSIVGAAAQSRGFPGNGGEGRHPGHGGGLQPLFGAILVIPQMLPPRRPPADYDPPEEPRHVRPHRSVRHREPARRQRTARPALAAEPYPDFVVPPSDEHRYVPDEVLVTLRNGASDRSMARMDRDLGLTPLETRHIALLDATVRRYRLRRGTTVAEAVRLLRLRGGIVTGAQPNYLFELQDDKSSAGPASAQYAVTALRLDKAHRLADGKDVVVAVIDSGIDYTNLEISGSVAARFNALDAPFAPDPHGTAMAGAIAAHGALVGAAPAARILAIRAFAGHGGGATGTSFDILEGLDFAAAHGAQIVNMSFAGPRDSLLGRALEKACDKGIVEIAAAGNGGPDAAPLYPAAEPFVIAITATDAEGSIFAKANRGPYLDAAAPGVDVLASAPGGALQMSSGTSIAAAEASGVAALVIERRPGVSPEEILGILRQTARRLKGGNSGKIGQLDALAAVEAAGPEGEMRASNGD